MKKLIITVIVFIFTALLNLAIFTYAFGYRGTKEAEIIYLALNILFDIFAVIIMIKIIIEDRYSYNKVLWIAILLLNPFAGVFFYFIFAKDFKTKQIEFFRPLIRDGEYIKYEPNLTHPLTNDFFKYIYQNTQKCVFCNDTKTTILTNGDELFPDLIKHLKNAQRFIYMSYYIIQKDELADTVIEILKEKARNGVDVRLLFDALGSRNIRGVYLKKIKDAGIKVAVFETLSLFHFFNALNFRYHRKITIIDGKYGYIGGLNLGKEYNHQSEKFGFWRDTHLRMEGRGIISLANIFIKDWYYTTGTWLNPTYQIDDINDPGIVVSVESGPDHKNAIFKELYFKMITEAKKSIYITTPYLMIEPEIEMALLNAKKSGIDVKILLPGKPDKFLINQATKSYYERLLKQNIEIYEYTDVFVHSKVVIIDEEIASIGTVNFDPRSFSINFEASVFLKNSSVLTLVKNFNDDLTKSNKIDLEKWQKRPWIFKIIQGFVGLFSPLF